MTTYRWITALVLLTLVSGLSTACVSRTPGEKLYRRHCAECHGIDGAGHTVQYMGHPEANLIDDEWVHGGSPTAIIGVLQGGSVGDHPDYSELSSAEMRQIVDHLRVLRGEAR
ncbi:MAG: c-type cytochrome [Acidobacteria bacterium]|nr:MAG: c-type cytochrome [Acidobacteriota bacterium]